jgi:hypothetical protein
MWQLTRKTDVEGTFFGFIVALGCGRKGVRSKQLSVMYSIAAQFTQLRVFTSSCNIQAFKTFHMRFKFYSFLCVSRTTKFNYEISEVSSS